MGANEIVGSGGGRHARAELAHRQRCTKRQQKHAFPSGHAAIAFGSAAFIQRRYGWHPGIPAYLVAAYVGWLRIETDDHDAADVIGGTAVGIISSYLLTKPFTDNVRASAWTDGKSAGLQIQVRW